MIRHHHKFHTIQDLAPTFLSGNIFSHNLSKHDWHSLLEPNFLLAPERAQHDAMKLCPCSRKPFQRHWNSGKVKDKSAALIGLFAKAAYLADWVGTTTENHQWKS